MALEGEVFSLIATTRDASAVVSAYGLGSMATEEGVGVTVAGEAQAATPAPAATAELAEIGSTAANRGETVVAAAGADRDSTNAPSSTRVTRCVKRKSKKLLKILKDWLCGRWRKRN
jgi:hypothetical protein